MTRSVHPSFIDMTGATVGTWLVVERLPNLRGKTRWLCRCTKCGAELSLRGHAVRNETPGCSKCGQTAGPRRPYGPRGASTAWQVALDAEEQLATQLNRRPSGQELADHLGISLQAAQSRLKKGRSFMTGEQVRERNAKMAGTGENSWSASQRERARRKADEARELDSGVARRPSLPRETLQELPPVRRLRVDDDDDGTPGMCTVCQWSGRFYAERCSRCGRYGTRSRLAHVDGGCCG